MLYSGKLDKIVCKSSLLLSPKGNELIGLGLVPLSFYIESELNILPRKPTSGWKHTSDLHALAVDAVWHIALVRHQALAFLPNIAFLQHLISIEEARLLTREATIAIGGKDPGRLPYEAAYGAFPALTEYRALFASRYCLQVVSRLLEGNPTFYQSYPDASSSAPALPLLPLLVHFNVAIFCFATLKLTFMPRTLEIDVSRFPTSVHSAIVADACYAASSSLICRNTSCLYGMRHQSRFVDCLDHLNCMRYQPNRHLR